MSAGIIIAIGIGIAAALLIVLLAVQRAGSGGPTRDGRELEPPDFAARGFGGRRRRRGSAPPQARRLAMIVAALAAMGAGLASFLANGHHH